MLTYTLIALILLLLYTGIIIYFIIGWRKTIPFEEISDNLTTKITVLVPFRNEEEHIINCLKSIKAQNYPSSLLQVLVINDSSTDQSPNMVADFITDLPNFELIHIKNGTGKKPAIAEAMKQATGILILATDADCIYHSNWLAVTASYYQKHQPKMIAGPVSFYEEKTMFEKMQSLEFLSLIGIGGASLSKQRPIMCNGANLAYEKSFFLEVNGFKDSNNIPTGDDVFLMFKIIKLYPNGVHFLKSNQAMVKTHAQKDVNTFLNQRKRWTSKTTLYNNSFVNFVAGVSYLFNLSILLTALLCFVEFEFTKLLIVLFFSKTFIDFVFLYLVCSFFKRTDLLKHIVLEQIFYIPYIVYIGIASMFGKYSWKGREIQH